MPAIRDLASRYVDRSAVLDPILATSRGVTGHDAEMTDYSPDGQGARDALDRETLAELSRLKPLTAPDRIAADVMRERLQVAIEQAEAGERLRDLRIIGSPFQAIRQCFDLMATTTEQDWEIVASRMERVPQALTSFEAALREGLSRGIAAARRQALACADQGATWSGQKKGPAFFQTLVGKYVGSNIALQLRLNEAAVDAAEAYATARRFLQEEYAPKAAERDAVGSERYRSGPGLFSALSSTRRRPISGAGTSSTGSRNGWLRWLRGSCQAYHWPRSSICWKPSQVDRSKALTRSATGCRS